MSPDSDPSGSSVPPLREAERRPVTLRCEARIGVGPWSLVFLRDLSNEGFQMGRIPGLRVGTGLRIKVPGLEMLSATVRWVGEERAGCAFNRPLGDYILDHIVRQASS
jgi:hypothetical protein